MKAQTQKIETAFSLTGLRAAVSDARAFTADVRNALGGIGKARPLDGVRNGIREATNAARDLKDALPADATTDVKVKVSGTAAAATALRSFGKLVKDTLSGDAGNAIDFDAVRGRLQERQRAFRDAAAAEAKAGETGTTSAKKADGAIRSLVTRLLTAKKASTETGDALEKVGTKGKAGADKTKTAADRAKAGLTGATTASVAFAGGVTRIERNAATAGFALTRAFGPGALSGLKSLADAARKAAGIGTLVVGLSGLSGGGLLAAVSNETADYTIAVEKLANVTGIQVQAFSRLAEIARGSGVDIDSLRGSLVQFAGQAAASTNSADIKKLFDDLGVSATDASGNVKDTLSLLLEVAKAQKTGVKGAKRAFILSQLFGEDDAAKVVKVLDKLGGTVSDVEKLIGGVDKSGAVVTEEDVKLANGYQGALAGLTGELRGIAREISRAVLPQITEFATRIGGVVSESRDGIIKVAVRAWKLFGEVISDVIKYFTGRGEFIKNSWIAGLLDLVAGVGRGMGAAGRAVLEFGDVLNGVGKDDKVFEFPWLFDLKARLDRVFGAGGRTLKAFFDLFIGSSLNAASVADTVEGSLIGMLAGLEDAFRVLGGAPPTTFLGRVAKDAADTVGYLNELRKAIVAVASGDKVDPKFAWVAKLAKESGEALESFKKTSLAVLDFVIVLKDMAADLGLTGDGLGSFIGKLAAFGLVAAAVIAPLSAVAGFLGAVGVASAAPLLGVLALAAGFGVLIAKLGEMTGIGEAVFGPLADYLNGTKEKLVAIRKEMDRSLDQNGGPKVGAMDAYRKLQQARKDQGLDFDDRALAAPAPVSPIQDTFNALPTFDTSAVLRAIQAAGAGRGDAIMSVAGASSIPGIGGTGQGEGTGSTLVVNVQLPDGSTRGVTLQAGPASSVSELGELIAAASRNRATQANPRFATSRG